MPKPITADHYSLNFLQVDRPSPLTDKNIENTIQEILSGHIDQDISDNVYTDFILSAEKWIFGSRLNCLTGITEFRRKDIIIGCTQFIDSLYMQGKVQTLIDDYRYHQRLGNGYPVVIGNIIPDIPLIVSVPFPAQGDIHEKMFILLDECLDKNVPVHIDGAWIPCSKDINFNFDHPSIVSVGISLSKGLGLGWNRVGVRWTKSTQPDSISIMNDFHMNNKVLVKIGLHFLQRFPIDYLWNTHRENYEKICNDFDLKPTNAIHLAMKEDRPVGVSPLLRYLEHEHTI